MSPKRITLICSSYPPETGAAPGRMYHLAQLLKENGYAVQVICAMPNYPAGKIFAPYRGKVRVKEMQEGIELVRLWMVPTNASGKLKRAASILSYCASLILLGLPALRAARPHLIIVSSPPFATGYIGTLLGKMIRAKIVLNISDIWPQTAYELGFIKAGSLYNLLLKGEKSMYRRSDAFSVQSESIREHLQAKAPGKPVFTYRNLQAAVPEALLERPEGTRKMVYAGLLGIAQGVLDIIRNIDFAACGTELHIYGQGNELPQIQEFIRMHPERNIYYHGSFAANDTAAILRNYHLMLVPLSTEIAGAVPSKIFLAMAHGIPLLFCGTGEGAAIVAQQGIGLVSAPGDQPALQVNIEKMVGMNTDAYEAMRRACRHSSEGPFNRDKQDKAFLAFLENPGT